MAYSGFQGNPWSRYLMTPLSRNPASALTYGLLLAKKAAQIVDGDLRAERQDQHETEVATEKLLEWLASEETRLPPLAASVYSEPVSSAAEIRRLLQGNEGDVATAIHASRKSLSRDY